MIVRTIYRPETAFRFYLDDMLDRFQYYKDHGVFPEYDDEGEEKRIELYEMLTEEQRIAVWGLSADLYSLLDKEQPPASDVTLTREEIAGQLETAYSASNWSELLRMLRYQNNLMPRAVVDYMRYRAWSELGYQEVALAFIQNAVRLDPEIEGAKARDSQYASAVVTLAFALLHLDKAGQAIELLDSWIQSNPENLEFHAARGIVSLTTDYESAIRDFGQAVKYRTKSALPYLEYSNWLLYERRYQDAVDTAQNGLRSQLRASDRAKLLHLMGIGFAFTNSLIEQAN